MSDPEDVARLVGLVSEQAETIGHLYARLNKLQERCDHAWISGDMNGTAVRSCKHCGKTESTPEGVAEDHDPLCTCKECWSRKGLGMFATANDDRARLIRDLHSAIDEFETGRIDSRRLVEFMASLERTFARRQAELDAERRRIAQTAAIQRGWVTKARDASPAVAQPGSVGHVVMRDSDRAKVAPDFSPPEGTPVLLQGHVTAVIEGSANDTGRSFEVKIDHGLGPIYHQHGPLPEKLGSMDYYRQQAAERLAADTAKRMAQIAQSVQNPPTEDRLKKRKGKPKPTDR